MSFLYVLVDRRTYTSLLDCSMCELLLPKSVWVCVLKYGSV